MKLDDLIEKCIICGGSGKNQQSFSIKSGSGFGRQVSQALISNTCETGGGTGRVNLTDSGEALLEFIRIMKRRGQV